MAGPLTGIGAGQIQPPVTQTFQPGERVEDRQADQQRLQNGETTQGQGSNGVEPVRAVENATEADVTANNRASSQDDAVLAGGDGRRGGIVNITV